MRSYISRLANVVHAALHRTGQITIRLADLPPGDDARCVFANGTIRVSRRLNPCELLSAIVHEWVHLARGPAHRDRRDIEEILVEQHAAEALIPQAAALAALDHRWTNREIARFAEAFGVDEAMIHQVVDPPTMPIPLRIPRQVSGSIDEVRKASRRRHTG